MTAHGGQNPVEAIVAGKPVIVRTTHGKFRNAGEQLLEQGGAVVARDPTELVSLAGRILRDTDCAKT